MHESGAECVGGLLAACVVARPDPDVMASGHQLASDLKAGAPVCSGDECRGHAPR